MKLTKLAIGRAAGLLVAAGLGLLLGGGLAAVSIIIPATRPAAQPVSVAAPPAAATATAAAAVAVAAPAAAAPQDASQQVSAAPAAPAPAAQPTVVPQHRITILLMGVDNRPDEPVARTDTIMLVSIDPQTGAAGIISLARDLFVDIPGRSAKAKINTAHLYGEIYKYPGGGPALLRETVAQFLGYRADYWVRVNFDGFRQIIDQIGGIDIDVPTPINDPLYPDELYGYDPLYIPAGRIHMDGTLALKYARTRHTDSDYGRARRQQQVVLAVKDKLLQPGQLGTLLPRLPALAVTLGKSVQTDMPVNKLIDLGRVMMNQGALTSVQSAVIDDKMGTDANDPTWGFVLIPDLTMVRSAAAVAMGDAPAPAQPVAAVGDPAVLKEAARVAVLNGTSQSALATEVADRLSAEGFRVIGTGRADNENYNASWLITRGSSAPATAAALARSLHIAADHVRSEPADNTVDFVVIAGADQVEPVAAAQTP